MSGSYKRRNVTISSDTYERLLRESSLLQEINRDLPQILNSIREETDRERERLHREMERRQKMYEKTIKSLRSELRGLEEKNLKSLQKQREEFLELQRRQKKEFDKEIDDLKKWTEIRLRRQREEYLEIASKHQREISLLKAQVKAIFEKDAKKEIRAKTFLEDLEKLVVDTDLTLPHAKFALGKLQRIKDKIAMARNNLEAGSSEAALAGLQTAYFDLVDLREEVLRKKSEFDLAYLNTLEAVKTLLKIVRKNRGIRMEDDQGKEIELETDFWTNGEYLKLQREIEFLEQTLRQRYDTLSIDEVNIINDQLSTLTEKHQKLLKEATERIVASQARAEIADIVREQLEKQGFTIINRGYEAQDQRKAYILKAKNIAGTEVVVLINPDKERHNVNSVNIAFSDASYVSEESLYERAKEITDPLAELGLEISPPEKDREKIDISEIYDTEAILRSGLSDKLKKKLAID